MKFTDVPWLIAYWVGLMSVLAFVLFGYDKWQAGRRGGRLSEFALCLVSATGGWPGGLLGILIFRHKSAKALFQVKFTIALLVWVALVWTAWHFGPGPAGNSRLFSGEKQVAFGNLASVFAHAGEES